MNSKIDFRRVENVGPKVSAELLESSVIAISLALAAMLFYIWVRLEWQFSIGSIEVDIAADFTIRAGQTIFIDTSSGTNDESQETNKEIGGKYLIAVVKHAINNGKGITKLGLVRDSVGRDGKPHSGSMVN